MIAPSPGLAVAAMVTLARKENNFSAPKMAKAILFDMPSPYRFIVVHAGQNTCPDQATHAQAPSLDALRTATYSDPLH